MPPTVDFRPDRSDREPGAGLLQAMVDELREVYDGLDLRGPDMPRAEPEDFAPPGGAFLVGWRDGTPVCCGGLKRLPDGTAEIKRMFVVPEARGQGVARLLLGALEATAAAMGYEVVRLDTGPRQPHAQALYESAGYQPIGNFNAHPTASYWGEKRLDHRRAFDDRPAALELLTNLKRDHTQLTTSLDRASSHWGYEDPIYRFWHQSFKVYYLQNETRAMLEALRAISPGGRPFHPWFEEIISAGTGQHFEREHNERWLEVTRPILEAFWHTRFFIEMAVKYGQELDDPPAVLPSGWAALLYLYEVR